MVKLDLTWWLYAADAALCWYTFCLFLWWRVWKTRGASKIYDLIMILILGLAISRTGSIYVRYYKFYDEDLYSVYLGSWWWGARLLLPIICMGFLAVYMSYRAFWKKYYDE